MPAGGFLLSAAQIVPLPRFVFPSLVNHSLRTVLVLLVTLPLALCLLTVVLVDLGTRGTAPRADTSSFANVSHP